MKTRFLLPLFGLILILSGCATDNSEELKARQELRNSQIPFSQDAFLKAIADGDEELVDLFIAGKIDKTGLENAKPVSTAAEYNQKKIVEKLLNSGFEVDEESYNGTPLCIAAKKGFKDITELLIAKGADVNYLNENLNPLIIACENGKSDIVPILLNAKADVNIQGETTKMSPLIMAARYGYTDIVKMLLEQKADAQAEDHAGNSAIYLAVYNTHSDTAKALINDKNLKPEDIPVSAMAMALSRNMLDVAKDMIDKGFNINADYTSMPLVSWAINNHYTEAAKLLITSGADLNKKDTSQMLPIDYALSTGNKEISEMIKEQTKKVAEPEVAQPESTTAATE